MIGIFDSGVGGMTVARAIEERLPGCGLLYFGDLARTPYGSKSAATIQRYAVENTRLLCEQGALLIVIACNSASSVATDIVRRQFDLPVFEVISPAVELAVQRSRSGRIGVIGTRATIDSGIYQRLIEHRRPGSKVFAQACPLLVPLVEEGWRNRRETKMILRRYLAPLRRQQVDTLVLGCTHYPLLRHLIQPRIGRRVEVIDSAQALADQLSRFLGQHPELSARLQAVAAKHYLVSDQPPTAAATAAAILGRQVDLETIPPPTRP